MGSSASVAELPDWARCLLTRSRVAHLGVIDDDGTPRVLPITFAVLGEELVSAVDQKPKRLAPADLARVRWLRARPRATITVDRYDDAWSALAWVQAPGRVELLDAASARGQTAVAALAERYAQYRISAPPGPVLALAPERVLWWRASDSDSGSG